MPPNHPSPPWGRGRDKQRNQRRIEISPPSPPQLRRTKLTEYVASDIEVDATIMRIAQAFGIHLDRVAPIVDRYGVGLSEAALEMAQAEMARGFTPQSPFGYMVSLLSKGLVQAQSQVGQAGKAEADALYERYHRGKKYCSCCNPEPMSEQEWIELRGKA